MLVHMQPSISRPPPMATCTGGSRTDGPFRELHSAESQERNSVEAHVQAVRIVCEGDEAVHAVCEGGNLHGYAHALIWLSKVVSCPFVQHEVLGKV